MPAPDIARKTIFVRRLFWSLVAVDCLLVVVLGSNVSTGGDAAGNGMANGFAFLLEIAAFALFGLLGLIFMFVRAFVVRWFLIGIVAVFGVIFSILAIFQLAG